MSNAPTLNDVNAWVSVAQHYGLPTRLLDWTESFLIALFFAVLPSDADADGAVWLLNASQLNSTFDPHERHGVFGENDEAVFLPLSKLLYPEATPAHKALDYLAYKPRYSDARMAAQLACFTLHTSREPLDLHASSQNWLRVVRVPNARKPQILASLTTLGVSESTIFPDLMGLARELVRRQSV